MWQLLSFSGRWDPKFFEGEKTPQLVGEQLAEQKVKTHEANVARGKVRLARKFEGMYNRWKWLYPDQLALLHKLWNGSLVSEANRLTRISGHGKIKRHDGSYINIGGSTGGMARKVLYNWAPPALDEEDQ